ncbi:MAG: oligosaccharide flippase family protein [Prolixibacteraceae bacterium]|nr:oligosaccharide flippase family protein [Prolixibacteraceae bacterium]
MKKKIHKLIREDNFLSLSGNLIIALLGFVGFALLARSFDKQLFGEWVLFITSGAFVEMFRFGITNNALIRYLSGVSEEEKLQFIGSNWLIGLNATVIIAIILILCNRFFAEPINKAGYSLFFTWYPLLAFLNLPYNTALVILQAHLQFGKIFVIKAINSGGQFLVILFHFLVMPLSLMQLVLAILVVNAVTSGISIISGWDGIKHFRKANRRTNRILLNFGKYTTFTLIGTNLLRSADTLIISLSPLGTAAVALYSIPLKLTELQQIPLRSFAATAFPKLSKASLQGKIEEVKKIFYTYSGAMTYFFFIVSLITFAFAGFFVEMLGGKEYLGVDPLTGFNTVTIMRIFSIYGLLLPVDRMTGIGLDSINKPGLNAIKVFLMVVLNVVGDIIAIFIYRSLEMVAVASIIFTIAGIVYGFYLLNKELHLQSSRIFSEGISFYKSLFRKAMAGY